MKNLSDVAGYQLNRFELDNRVPVALETFHRYRDSNYADDEALFPKRLMQGQHTVHRLCRQQLATEKADGRTKRFSWSWQLMSWPQRRIITTQKLCAILR
jgi:hypothetical protein